MKFGSKIPYVVVSAVSVVFIAMCAASRTIDVPLVGVEYYIWYLERVSKVLQLIMIGMWLYLVSAAPNPCRSCPLMNCILFILAYL
jgi:hypothetical protein